MEAINIYISEKFFTYDGHPSYLYGLRFSWLENSPDTAMASEKEYYTSRVKTRNTFKISKTDHPEPLLFDAEILSDRVLSEQEVRRIYSVFFNKNQYKKLIIPTDSGENIHLNAIMTGVEREEGGVSDSFGVIGFKLQIRCDAPWGWTDTITVIPNITPENRATYFSIYNYSDSDEYIYPMIEASVYSSDECGESTVLGSLPGCIACAYRNDCWSDANLSPVKAMIINQSDSLTKGMCLFADTEEKTFIINPDSGVIKDTNNINQISNTNKVFIRLLPGENIFYTENIKNIKFSFKEARVIV